MRSLLPYLPFYIPVVGVLAYLVKHEKSHTRIDILLKNICAKLNIKD